MSGRERRKSGDAVLSSAQVSVIEASRLAASRRRFKVISPALAALSAIPSFLLRYREKFDTTWWTLFAGNSVRRRRRAERDVYLLEDGSLSLSRRDRYWVNGQSLSCWQIHRGRDRSVYIYIRRKRAFLRFITFPVIDFSSSEPLFGTISKDAVK